MKTTFPPTIFIIQDQASKEIWCGPKHWHRSVPGQKFEACFYETKVEAEKVAGLLHSAKRHPVVVRFVKK